MERDRLPKQSKRVSCMRLELLDTMCPDGAVASGVRKRQLKSSVQFVLVGRRFMDASMTHMCLQKQRSQTLRGRALQNLGMPVLIRRSVTFFAVSGSLSAF